MGQVGWERQVGARLALPHPHIGSVTKAQLQTTLAEFKDTQAKLMEQESILKELQERGESRTQPPGPRPSSLIIATPLLGSPVLDPQVSGD